MIKEVEFSRALRMLVIVFGFDDLEGIEAVWGTQ